MKKFSDQLRKAPFIRILFPFVIGILAGEVLPTLRMLYLLCGLGLTLMGLFLSKKTSFRHEAFEGIIILLIFFEFGLINSKHHRFLRYNLPKQEYLAILDEYPVEKNNSYKAIIQLLNQKSKILVYFEKTPELEGIEPGTLLKFSGRPELIQNPGNPFEFDYQRYMEHRNIGHRIYLTKSNVVFFKEGGKQNIRHKALIYRNSLIHILETKGIKGETLQVISSIALGARDELDKETLQSFSNTGAIHILSVSGLHVGIIYLVINYLFHFLQNLKRGNILRFLVVFSTLWFYALITGLSPAVLRATTMLSFVIIGKFLSRNTIIYNTLAASAFVLLTFEPDLIFNIGFQLSYLAVIGIILIQPVLYQMIFLRNYILDKTWLCLTVSVAAQIGTLPLTIHYFHQFPTYFWLTNLIVILQSTLIIYLTFFILIISPLIPLLGQLSAKILVWNTDLMLLILKKIESLPEALFTNIYIPWHIIFIGILVGIFIVLFFIRKRLIFLNYSLLLITILMLLLNVKTYRSLKQREIVIFNIPGQTVIAFTSGRESTIISNQGNQNKQKIEYYVEPYCGMRWIKHKTVLNYSEYLSLSKDHLKIKNGMINFNGLTLTLEDDSESHEYSTIFQNDIVILTKTNNDLLKYLMKNKICQAVILVGPNWKSTFSRLNEENFSPKVVLQDKAIKLIYNTFTSDKKIIISNDF